MSRDVPDDKLFGIFCSPHTYDFRLRSVQWSAPYRFKLSRNGYDLLIEQRANKMIDKLFVRAYGRSSRIWILE